MSLSLAIMQSHDEVDEEPPVRPQSQSVTAHPSLCLPRLVTCSSIFSQIFAQQFREAHERVMEENRALTERVNRLEMQLFWMKYNPNRLRDLLLSRIIRGRVYPHTMCMCGFCLDLMRPTARISVSPRPCRVLPIFKRIAAKHDIVVYAYSAGDHDDPGMTLYRHTLTFDRVSNKRAHIVFLDEGNWRQMCYGTLLWECDWPTDPDLVKLHAFWQELSRFNEFSQD